MKRFIFLVFILATSYFILNTFPVFAQSKVLINEFLIDPLPQTVELFNSGNENADISNWVIDDSGGTTFFTIPYNNIIFPNQCLVFSGDFNLNKTTADIIRLFDSNQQIIDSFSYKSSSGSGISYFRYPDGSDNWISGNANLGKYNFSMEQACLFPTLTSIQPTPTDSTDSTDSIIGSVTPDPYTYLTTSPILSPIQLTPTDSTDLTNVYLSEVMINPNSGEKEWIEIYNNNDFSITLTDWYIDDLENAGSSPKIFSLLINAKSYDVIDVSSSIFNNDGDSVRLLDLNKNLKDDFEYKKSEQGKTLGRTTFESDDFCLQEPSKNLTNNPCIYPTPTNIQKCLGQACLSPTEIITKIKLPINMGLINQTPTKKLSPIFYLPDETLIKIDYTPPDVLGATDKLIINSPNQKILINLLCFISFSYSLLTISSVLFRMKLLYGKNKNFFTPPLHSS